MRIIILITVGLCLILADGVTTSAQNMIPPPGFVPGQEDDIPPTPPQEPRVFPDSTSQWGTNGPISPPLTENPRIYSGSTDHIPLYGSPGGPARRYGARNRTRDVRTFPQPASPELIVSDGPPLPIVWFRAEALAWWSKNSPMPVPVVTLGNPANNIPGAIGQPDTSILLGGQDIKVPGQGGGRYTFGFSFDPAQTWGFEASYFSLASAGVTQRVTSNGRVGSAFLAFPFFDPLASHESASPISFPGAFAGTAVLSTQSFLQGTDLNFLHNVMSSDGVRVDLLGGLRYVNLQESLDFNTRSPNVPPHPPAFFNTFDSFGTNNRFYGGQVGVRASYDANRFFVNAAGKLAMGGTVETVSVNGGTFTNINGGFQSAPGAYLSQPTNLGTQTRDQFAVVPELNLNFGFRLRPWASVIVGYSFLYISSVARPGDQIDRVINPSQSSAITNNFPATLTGPARPELNVHNTDFWAQGLNFALELRF